MRFTIPLVPRAQMRARHFVKRTKAGKIFSGTYKDREQARYEEQLMQLLVRHRPERPFEGPVVLGITAYLPIPRSKPAWWKEAAEKGMVFPTGRPDYDNLVKNLKDCMTRLAFWRDDSQVIGYDRPAKLYSANPRWEITVREIRQPGTKAEYMEMTGRPGEREFDPNQLELQLERSET